MWSARNNRLQSRTLTSTGAATPQLEASRRFFGCIQSNPVHDEAMFWSFVFAILGVASWPLACVLGWAFAALPQPLGKCEHLPTIDRATVSTSIRRFC